MSNSKQILDSIPLDLHADACDGQAIIDLLGLNWNPFEDIFSFNTSFDKLEKNITKRIVLASVVKFFDELGWLSPVIVKSKIFLQKLWLNKIDLDHK